MPSQSKKWEIQQALTWNMRCLRSGFGRQVYSAKRTEPEAGIGSSNRDAFMHVRSLAHLRIASVDADVSPHFIDKLTGAPDVKQNAHLAHESSEDLVASNLLHGVQKDSRRATSARATFGAETRDGRNKQFMDEELEKAFYGRGTPGPMVYNAVGSLGNQPLSTKETSGRCKIGTGGRFNYNFVEVAKRQPGAGQYNSATNALGKQVRSKLRTLPAYGFGTSTRDGMKRIFISPDHEKQNFGVGTPGPATASKQSAFRQQKLSQKKTAPGWGFGTSTRSPRHPEESYPGPGAYCA